MINEIKQGRKNNQNATEAKKELSEIKRKIAITKRSLKQSRDEFSLYNRAAKPFLDAKKLLTQQDNYLHYDEIKSRYKESKARAEAQKIALSLQEKRNKAEKEAYAKKLKEARKNKKAKNEKIANQKQNTKKQHISKEKKQRNGNINFFTAITVQKIFKLLAGVLVWEIFLQKSTTH